MKKNIKKNEKIVRVIVGVVLVLAGYYYGAWWLYLLAVIALLTGIFSYCPLYSLFPKKEDSSTE